MDARFRFKTFEFNSNGLNKFKVLRSPKCWEFRKSLDKWEKNYWQGQRDRLKAEKAQD